MTRVHLCNFYLIFQLISDIFRLCILNLKSFQELHFPQRNSKLHGHSVAQCFPWKFMYIYIMSSHTHDFPFRFPSKRLAHVYEHFHHLLWRGRENVFFCVHVCCSFPPRFGCSWKEMKNWLYLYEWEKWRQIGSISRTNLTIGYLRNATYIVDQYTRIFAFKSFRELQIIWFNVMNF